MRKVRAYIIVLTLLCQVGEKLEARARINMFPNIKFLGKKFYSCLFHLVLYICFKNKLLLNSFVIFTIKYFNYIIKT